MTSDKLVLEKASSPMVVTESGMVTEVSPVLLKAPLPMVLTELPMVTEVKLLQPMKAPLSMEVTKSAIMTEIKLIQKKINLKIEIEIGFLEY